MRKYLFGLAFKPNIDTVCAKARRWGCRNITRWHSGEAWSSGDIKQVPKGGRTFARWRRKLDAALTAADVLVMLVDHDEFKAIPGDAVHQRYAVDTKVWLMKRILVTGGAGFIRICAVAYHP